jgi:hypothetical protein
VCISLLRLKKGTLGPVTVSNCNIPIVVGIDVKTVFKIKASNAYEAECREK